MGDNEMKSVLISVQPKWVEKIASDEKTIEVRKTRPKVGRPFKVYIYCTKGEQLFNNTGKITKSGVFNTVFDNHIENINGKVIGEFVCDRMDEYKFNWAEFTAYANRTYLISEKQLKNTCLSREEFNAYGCTENEHKEKLYGWHISELKIYDKPKELSEFFTPIGERPSYMIERPPQSWCYVEE
jgi:predicted transcriptional regulator